MRYEISPELYRAMMRVIVAAENLARQFNGSNIANLIDAACQLHRVFYAEQP